MKDYGSMDDETFIKEIEKMPAMELLNLVVTEPELLTDSYYRKFRLQIIRRCKAIEKKLK